MGHAPHWEHFTSTLSGDTFCMFVEQETGCCVPATWEDSGRRHKLALWNLFSQHRLLSIKSLREETMLKVAALLALLASPALAQDKAIDAGALKDCTPIGQSAWGELIYGMDCAALKPENRVEVLPNMPETNLKDTVIPNSGGVDNPKDTPTKGESR